jgi:hypothetical protein
MCRHCRHKDLDSVVNAIRSEFDLQSIFAGDMKACLKAVAKRLNELKKTRANIARTGRSTYLIDCQIRALRFGAWVLNKSIRDLKSGREPWLNGYYPDPDWGCMASPRCTTTYCKHALFIG